MPQTSRPQNLRFKDNDSVLVQPKYGNLTRNRSKEDDGYYYTLEVTQPSTGDVTYRINANAALAQAIANNWCGRGGTLEITRLNAKRWDVAVRDEPDTIYALEMREWDEGAHQFVTVDFDIPAEGEAAPAQTNGHTATPKPTAPPAAPPAAGAEEWARQRQLLADAITITQAALNDAQASEFFNSTDVQKFATTLYMEALKRNFAPLNPGTPVADILTDAGFEAVEDDTEVPF